MIVGIVVSVGAVSFLSLLAICYSVQRRKRQKRYEDEGKQKSAISFFSMGLLFLVCDFGLFTEVLPGSSSASESYVHRQRDEVQYCCCNLKQPKLV